MSKKKKPIERICKNCKLFNPVTSECAVVVVHEGRRLKLPVIAEEPCFFEGTYFDPTTKEDEDFAGDINELKFWVEDEDGNKTNKNGKVKMEIPEHLLVDQMDPSDIDTFKFLKMKEELEYVRELEIKSHHESN